MTHHAPRLIRSKALRRATLEGRVLLAPEYDPTDDEPGYSNIPAALEAMLEWSEPRLIAYEPRTMAESISRGVLLGEFEIKIADTLINHTSGRPTAKLVSDNTAPSRDKMVALAKGQTHG